MKIHYIQHEKFEDLGCIRQWLKSSNHSVTHTHIFENEPFPKASDIDFLIVMGGSMGANDDQVFSWMEAEKALIKQCILDNKKVLGICLGAQIIASVLGAKVYPNTKKEIGWFDIDLKIKSKEIPAFANIPSKFKTMHWHGDTFELPRGAVHLASSEATQNQAFSFNDGYVLGLQFHPEMTELAIKGMFDEVGQLQQDDFVQSNQVIASQYELCQQNNDWMYHILSSMTS